MKNSTKSIVVIIILQLLCISSFSQTGRDFWFAAPDVSANHIFAGQVNGTPIFLNITAEGTTNVTLTSASDSTFSRTVRLTQGQSFSWRMDTILSIDSIETVANCPDSSNFVQNRGLHITSDSADITAYYELDNTNNRDIFSLKGKNALGKDFWVSTQRAFNNGINYLDAFSGFVVLATEDNTTVTVTNNGNNLNYLGSRDTVIILNKGQTFSYRAASIADSLHIFGIRVQADKDISVTIYDDSIAKINNVNGITTSWDIVGDQLIPANLTGREYLIIQGNIFASAIDGGEKVFITATAPNTILQISDTSGIAQDTIVNAGDYYEHDINSPNTFISSNNPIYVFHLTGVGNGGEMGGAILPPVDNCTGSNKITVRRSINVQDPFIINLILRNDTNSLSPRFNACTTNFQYTITNSNGIIAALGTIPDTCFDFIQNNCYAIFNANGAQFFQTGNTIVQPGDILTLQNDTARFHLGVLNGGPVNGGKYGYFSDFSEGHIDADINNSNQQELYTCNIEPVTVYADGGFNYVWKGLQNGVYSQEITDMITPLSDSAIFTPAEAGKYTIRIIGYTECFDADSTDIQISIGDSKDVTYTQGELAGCSPFATIISNTTESEMDYSWTWKFESANDVTVKDDLGRSFSWCFPENTSDTNQIYKVKLIGISPYEACSDSIEKEFIVAPELEVNFTATPESGNSPLDVQLTSTSKNASSIVWELNDTIITDNEAPLVTLEPESDKNYEILLIGSNGICSDTAKGVVEVYYQESSIISEGQSANYDLLYLRESNELLFNYEIQSSCKLGIIVADLSGKIIYSEEINNLTPGSFSKSINLSSNKNKLLLVRINFNGKTNTHRFLVQ